MIKVLPKRCKRVLKFGRLPPSLARCLIATQAGDMTKQLFIY